jgi:4-amino-4-deoxy-L-arabinose transferase-like glycosyltransferase
MLKPKVSKKATPADQGAPEPPKTAAQSTISWRLFSGTSRMTTVVDRLSVGRGMARSSLKRNLAALAVVSLLLFPSLASFGAQNLPEPEQYGTTDTGVALRWYAYEPQGGG